jgi:hypothetical protein
MNDWKYIKKLGGQGILKKSDVVFLKSQRARVLFLMMDGHWHLAGQIIKASGGREGLRRMRELREIPNVTIDRERAYQSRDFMYRLIYKPGIQQDLFL